jgi:hypothetical protein
MEDEMFAARTIGIKPRKEVFAETREEAAKLAFTVVPRAKSVSTCHAILQDDGKYWSNGMDIRFHDRHNHEKLT